MAILGQAPVFICFSPKNEDKVVTVPNSLFQQIYSLFGGGILALAQAAEHFTAGIHSAELGAVAVLNLHGFFVVGKGSFFAGRLRGLSHKPFEATGACGRKSRTLRAIHKLSSAFRSS